MRITGINNNANSVRVHDYGNTYTKSGLLAYALNVNKAKYANISVAMGKSTLTHEINGGAMSIKHKTPKHKEHTLFIYQREPFGCSELTDNEYYNDIIVLANRNCCGINNSEYSYLFTALADGDLLDSLDDYEWYGYKNMTEMINDSLGVDATPVQVGKVKKACEEWRLPHYGKEDIIAKIMTIFTPHTWESTTITGYCQGDWADIIYPTDVYSKTAIDCFEAFYFGMYMDYEARYNGDSVLYTFCDFEGEDAIIKEISEDYATDNVKYHSYY